MIILQCLVSSFKDGIWCIGLHHQGENCKLTAGIMHFVNIQFKQQPKDEQADKYLYSYLMSLWTILSWCIMLELYCKSIFPEYSAIHCPMFIILHTRWDIISQDGWRKTRSSEKAHHWVFSEDLVCLSCLFWLTSSKKRKLQEGQKSRKKGFSFQNVSAFYKVLVVNYNSNNMHKFQNAVWCILCLSCGLNRSSWINWWPPREARHLTLCATSCQMSLNNQVFHITA